MATVTDGGEEKLAEPLVDVDKARLQRLEERLTSSGSNGLRVASVTVGFESPAGTQSCGSTGSNASSLCSGTKSRSRGTSNAGATSKPIGGITGKLLANAVIPDSPPFPTKGALDGIPEALSSGPRSQDSCGTLGNVVSRKRKLAPAVGDDKIVGGSDNNNNSSSSSNSSRGSTGSCHTRGDSKNQIYSKRNLKQARFDGASGVDDEPKADKNGFSREDDSQIMHFAFFERSSPVWLRTLSEKLGRSEKDIKDRYRDLMNAAAKVDMQDPRNNYSLDIITRTNSMSMGVLSHEGASHSNEIGAPGTTNAAEGAVAAASGNNSSSSNSKSERSKARRDRSASPMTASSASLKAALKNQSRIKQFFIPAGGADKRRKGSTNTPPSHISRTASISSELPMRAEMPQTPMPPQRRPSTSSDDNGAGLRRSSSIAFSTSPILATSGASSSSSSGGGGGGRRKSLSRSDEDEQHKLANIIGVPSGSDEKGAKMLEGELRSKEQELEALRSSFRKQEEEFSKARQLILLQKEELNTVQTLISTLQEEKSTKSDRTAAVLEKLIRKVDSDLHKYQRQKLGDESFRLGRIAVQKHGFGPRAKIAEVWEEGQDFKTLRVRQADLLQRKEDAEKRRRALQKSIKQRRANMASTASLTVAALEDQEATEAIAATMGSLRRLEQELSDQHTKLERERIFHIRAVKRLREEDQSRFNRQPVLNNRYLLRELLGKGGFSEVWRGFDLIELRDVAVKVHELTQGWSEQRKASYLKHATREYQIHLSLAHHRIVQLYDVFEIDDNSFATVLEYCEGTDLELHLKWRKQLSEREARAIMLQILSGLRYLNAGVDMDNGHDMPGATEASGEMYGGGKPVQKQEKRPRPSIIHYDLKPGNILFDGQGGVKITDFGLSKIMDNGDANAGIELTSQGAGTYWYLPPECFKTDRVVHISNKVDVWSCGVIFYQMLFGARPFGEGLSQDKVLLNNTMLQATKVKFPTKPSVSEEAKTFIRRCLTHDQALRPDVATLCTDPYLSMNLSGRK